MLYNRLLEAQHSCVILVDVQEKFRSTIAHWTEMIENTTKILKAAQLFNIPIITAEHYPHKLGVITESLQSFIDPSYLISKTTASCVKEPQFIAALTKVRKPQIVLVGMETHVCILQTAFELIDLNYEVFVVSEAVGSRHQQNKNLALQRMQAKGVHIVSVEMVLFEWLQNGENPQAKDIFKLVK